MKEEHQAELVWEYFGRKPNGTFVEVGAHDPRHLSLTWFLEQQGWKGLLVEPQPDLAQRLREQRPASHVFEVACGRDNQQDTATFYLTDDPGHAGLVPDRPVTGKFEVTIRTLDSLLAETDIESPDFVSVDVEGTELDVLKGFDLGRHRPALLFLEDFVEDLSKHRYMKAHGYRLIRRTGHNNWYVPKGTPYRIPVRDRLRILRKMYVGTPTRKLRRRLRHRG